MVDGPVEGASSPAAPPLVAEDSPRQADLAFLEESLNAYNIAATGCDDGRELALWLRDEDGGIAGGLYGWTWGDWLEVRHLWLREDRRGQGHGRTLLGAAEAEAIRRGCHWVFLDSYSFQASGFYQKLGYAEFAVLDRFPPGHRRHFFRKALLPPPSP